MPFSKAQRAEFFKELFSNCLIGLAIVDHEGRLVQVNERMVETFGYSKAEFEQMTFQLFTAPQDQTADREMFERVRQGVDRLFLMDVTYIAKNRQAVPARLCIMSIPEEDQYLLGQVMPVYEPMGGNEPREEARHGTHRFDLWHFFRSHWKTIIPWIVLAALFVFNVIYDLRSQHEEFDRVKDKLDRVIREQNRQREISGKVGSSRWIESMSKVVKETGPFTAEGKGGGCHA